MVDVLVQLKDAARKFPVSVVTALNSEDLAVGVHDGGADTDGVTRRGAHK
jgi:hypothetical protein